MSNIFNLNGFQVTHSKEELEQYIMETTAERVVTTIVKLYNVEDEKNPLTQIITWKIAGAEEYNALIDILETMTGYGYTNLEFYYQ